MLNSIVDKGSLSGNRTFSKHIQSLKHSFFTRSYYTRDIKDYYYNGGHRMAVEYKEIDLNKKWRFTLETFVDVEKNEYDDSGWRSLNLPHDWSVEFPFDEQNGEGCTAYLPGGIGWYRKNFITSISSDEGNVTLNFDGIYNHSEVYINGQLISERPYGYVPITCDLTPYLKPIGEENVIAVKVDRSRYVDSRWYPGSGIYRKVLLIESNLVNIPLYGTYITTPDITRDKGQVDVVYTVNNNSTRKETSLVKCRILDINASVVAIEEKEVELEACSSQELAMTMSVTNPVLWQVHNGKMYTLETRIELNDTIVYENKKSFAFRTIRFDVNEGFFLNNVSMKLKGVCIHHDGGLVGAAVPKGVWRRRLEMLIDGGCNAIRCSHNPPSAEFLDLCDELGLLVQHEFYDEWDNPKDKRMNMYERHDDYISRGSAEYFEEWGKIDLQEAVMRDRNHPSIIQWSIGNEIEWTYENVMKATGYFDANASGNYFWCPPPFNPEEIRERYNAMPKQPHTMEDTAKKLVRWTKELDITRPVTANCILPSGSHACGAVEALDVVGYSYRRVLYDDLHAAYPRIPIQENEALGQWHEWKAVIERPFVAGMFIWTGIDYLGESTEKWPQKSKLPGLLNLAGFDKPSYHMFKTLWSEENYLFIASNTREKSVYKLDADGGFQDTSEIGGWQQRRWFWHEINRHWNYENNEEILVEVYANTDYVELFLNEMSVGVKALSDFEDHVMKWIVPYEEGTLRAVGYKGNQKEVSVEKVIRTTGQLAMLNVQVDQKTLMADEEDVAHVVVQLVDDNNEPITQREAKIEFDIEGPHRLLGVDNGYCRSTQTFQNNVIETYEGRCLLIVQSTDVIGEIKIIARIMDEDVELISHTTVIEVVEA